MTDTGLAAQDPRSPFTRTGDPHASRASVSLHLPPTWAGGGPDTAPSHGLTCLPSATLPEEQVFRWASLPIDPWSFFQGLQGRETLREQPGGTALGLHAACSWRMGGGWAAPRETSESLVGTCHDAFTSLPQYQLFFEGKGSVEKEVWKTVE